MNKHTKYILASLLLFVTLPPSVPGQERAPGPSTRQIRARKMAQQWQNMEVILVLSDGQEVVGRIVKADFLTLTMIIDQKEQRLPIETIDTAIIRPGFPEILMAALSGSLGVALGYGATSLAAPDASTNIALMIAAGTGLATGIWGWRSFFTEIRYDLKGDGP